MHAPKTLQHREGGTRAGTGTPLDSVTRKVMELRFGHDFAGVRVHRAPEDAAATLNARSWTIGRDIFTTSAAQHDTRILAHELAHVVQQRGANPGNVPPLGERGSSHERAAMLAADAVIRGEPVPDPGRAPALLQRDDPPGSASAPSAPASAPSASQLNQPEEPKELASIELTFTPLNFQLPKGPQFFSPGLSVGMPFHLWEKGEWEFDLGPSLGFDFHFGETDVLPQTGGYTGTTIQGQVEGAITYNFAGGHKFSIKLAPGAGYTAFPKAELAETSLGIEGGLEYAYEPRKGLQFFGGLRGGVDWQWAQSHPGDAEAGGFIGLGAGFTFSFPVGRKQSKTPAKVQPQPTVQTPAPAGPTMYSAANVPRSVTAVEQADEAQYAQLVDYIARAAEALRTLAASPPAHLPWMKNNPNAQAVVTLVDELLAELRARSLIVRFDVRPGTQTRAAYDMGPNIMHLPPLAGAVIARLASSVIHEYVHVQQDRAIQQTLSTAHAPLEHTAEDELQSEIASYIPQNYFLAMLQQTSMNPDFAMEDRLRIAAFKESAEKMRTGSAKEAEAGRKRLRELIEPGKQAQIAANTPMRTYRLEIDTANRARLVTGTETFVDLGTIPQVKDRAELKTRITEAVRQKYGTEIRQLFTSGYQFVTLRVYQGTTELEQFEYFPGAI